MSKRNPEDVIVTLHAAFRLDPGTGQLFWRPGHGGAYSGKEAFTAKRPDGYHCGMIKGRMYRRARVVFALVHGFFPDSVDHVNHVRHDDRPENLRPATVTENNHAIRSRVGSSSKWKGVSYDKRREHWRWQVQDRDRKVVAQGSKRCETAALLARAKIIKGAHGDFYTA